MTRPPSYRRKPGRECPVLRGYRRPLTSTAHSSHRSSRRLQATMKSLSKRHGHIPYRPPTP